MPQLRYTIVTSSTLMLVGSLTYFDVIFILTGGGPGIATRLLPLHMYLSGFAFNEMGYASAIAVVLVVAGLLSLGLVRFSGFARMESHQEGVMATVTTLIVVVPLYWIVVTSLRSQAGFFTTSPLPPPTNPTLDNYRLVLESGFFRFLANSTIVTLAAVYDALQVWNGFLFPPDTHPERRAARAPTRPLDLPGAVHHQRSGHPGRRHPVHPADPDAVRLRTALPGQRSDRRV